MSLSERVVITGLGAVSPYGIGVDPLWKALKASKSGIALMPEDYGLKTKIAGLVAGYTPEEHFTKKEIKCYDRFIQYGILTARQACAQAKLLDLANINPERCGVLVGSGIGGIAGIQAQCSKMLTHGPGKISPFFIPSTLINMVAGFISIDRGFTGPNFSVVSACATGAHSVISAYQSIQTGMADIVLAGGAEYATTELGMAGFSTMRALSSRNDDPEGACRPWDQDRDGFVMSDGAGVLVVERLSHALRRGAPILAELKGVGMSGDAHHMTQPDPGAGGAYRCMAQAIQLAGLKPNQVGYINAHATSTPRGDENEPKAIKRLFSEYAYKIPVSSTKSMHGHLLGAAGAIEAVVTLCALGDQIVPPTLNCQNPSPGCDLDFVIEGARALSFDHALSNSFGFGGTNACLLFSKFQE